MQKVIHRWRHPPTFPQFFLREIPANVIERSWLTNAVRTTWNRFKQPTIWSANAVQIFLRLQRQPATVIKKAVSRSSSMLNRVLFIASLFAGSTLGGWLIDAVIAKKLKCDVLELWCFVCFLKLCPARLKRQAAYAKIPVQYVRSENIDEV